MTDQNGTFRIAVRKFDAFESATQKIWDKFCLLSGCKLTLEMVVMDLPELHGTTLTQSGLRNGNFDIAHINTDWIDEGYLRDLFCRLNIRDHREKANPLSYHQIAAGLEVNHSSLRGN